jgi:hypothetical protein
VADVFTLYKIPLLLDLVGGCLVFQKCFPYSVYPWSPNGILSSSSTIWLLLHVLVAVVYLHISALRILSIENKKLSLWFWYLFCLTIVTNFWRFGDVWWGYASLFNLSPLVVAYLTYDRCQPPRTGLRWLHFLAIWSAPGFEIFRYYFVHPGPIQGYY